MEINSDFISFLFSGDECIGEVLVAPQDTDHSYVQYLFGKEIRISFLSQASERCLPLTVLHTIASSGPWFKMVPTEGQLQADYHRLDSLYSSCLAESKTAVVPMEDGNELHLVAMGSRPGIPRLPCFWAFVALQGMYTSCLGMLNLRCLALVFDLDETLVVANTIRSFDNRMEATDRKLRSATEVDPQRRATLAAELKRYQDDRNLLKQFVDNDQIVENGIIVAAQGELVPALSDGALQILRPVIRLPDRNMVITRINPAIRDTSVLVRLRPAWEELRSYLIAKGRKRFEVYICTMSERDYALEMWRLLDPEARLINLRELGERVLCVKAGNKKSLLNVFPNHRCHPKMAMVVDDRLKVWEESDQPRVHVVPAFAPYYSPQAETSSQIPVLCVARNVACNVRAGFFKHFDENLAQQMEQVHFDTDVATLPNAPDISNYLVSDAVNTFMPQNFPGENEEPPRLPPPAPQMMLVPPPTLSHNILAGNHIAQPTMNLEPPQQEEVAESYMYGGGAVLQHYQQQQPAAALLRPLNVMQLRNPKQGASPAREEGEVPESELDPDTRRRLLILQHGMDTNYVREVVKLDDPSHGKPPPGVITSYASPGGWLGVEEEMSPRRLTRASPELVLEPELMAPFDSQEQQQGPPGFTPIVDSAFLNHRGVGPRHPRRRFPQEDGLFDSEEQREGQDGFQVEHSSGSDDEEQPLGRNLPAAMELQFPSDRLEPTDFVDVLEGIGQQVRALVEFKTLLTSSSARLLFTVEVIFAGQKVGEGTGRTKKEARFRAAEDALRFLAMQFPPNQGLGSRLANNAHPFLGPPEAEEPSILARPNSRDPRISAGLGPGAGVGGGSGGGGMELVVPSTSGQVGFGDFQRPAMNFVATLKERCTVLGVNVNFQDLPTTGAPGRKFFHCQVEVGGQVLGKGSGLSWDNAKQQAAEDAMRHLKPSKRINTSRSPRSPPMGAKRVRIGLPSSPGRGRGWSSPRRRPPVP